MYLNATVASFLCLASWGGAFALLGHGITTSNHTYGALAIFVAVFAGGCLYGAISEFMKASRQSGEKQKKVPAI